MNVRARLAGLTLIIVVLCTLAYSLVGSGILWPILGLVCVGVHLIVHGIEGRDNLMLPRWVVVITALAVLTWGITRALSGSKIDALCECVLALMFIKLWDRKAPSDYAQILTLAVYLAIGCTVRGDFGPVMVTAITIPILLAATMLFQISAGQHRFSRSGARVSQVPWSNSSFASLFIAGFALIALVSSMIFLLMPRGPMMDSAMMRSSASWVARMGGIGHVSGFSDRVELGRGGLISESRAIIAEVTVQPGDDAVQRAIDVLHLRGAVLENYDKGIWVARTAHSPELDIDSHELKPGNNWPFGGTPNVASAARQVRIRVVMRGVDGKVPAFAPWWPAAIEFAGAARLRLDRHTLIMQRIGTEGAFAYTVTSFMGASVDPAAAPTRRSQDRPAVDFPNEKVKQIAQEILKRSAIEPDPSARAPSEDGRAARAIEAFLRREFTYTLQLLAAPPGRDPIEWFLTTSKQGHCEYFASAMVALCRSVGIPARLVTGYVAAENSNPGMFVVRESNAHAWVEAAVDGFPPDDKSPEGLRDPLNWHSWRTFDPTPPADFMRIHQPEPTVSLRFGKFLSALESAWSSNILRFDDRRQAGMLAAQGVSTNWLETKLTRLSMHFGGEESTQKERLVRWGSFAALFVVGGSLLGWLVNVLLARWRHRRRRSSGDTRHESIVRPELAALRDEYVRLLSRYNFSRSPQEPLLVHLTRYHAQMEACHTELPIAAAGFIDLLYEGQFGPGLSDSQLQDARTRCTAIELLLRSEK